MKTFELPISANYINHWGLQEAVRELLQNAIDATSAFTFEIIGSTLIISNEESKLTASDLVLGTSSKQDDKASIGKFGEGFKLALAVLARENREIIVNNNGKTWIPEYRLSEQFNCDILHIDEHEMSQPEPGLHFVLRNLTDDELNLVRRNCLHMQPHYPEHLSTKYGNIILSHKVAKLFVNGLFVTDTDLKYTYDMKPEYLSLERDRQTVSDFDLQWLTSKMWADRPDEADKVADAVAANVKDVSYLANQVNKTATVIDTVHDNFVATYGTNARPASDQREADYINSNGGRAAVVSTNHRTMVMASPKYNPPELRRAPAKVEELQEFFSRNKKYMRRPAIVACKKLIAKWSEI